MTKNPVPIPGPRTEQPAQPVEPKLRYLVDVLASIAELGSSAALE
jgi:hypothetical protein